MKNQRFVAAYVIGFLCWLSFPVVGQMVVPKMDYDTFIGAEHVAANAVRTVFAVESGHVEPSGNIRLSTVGSGFFVMMSPKTNYPPTMFGITCNHVINVVPPENTLFIGLDTKKGYQRVIGKVIYRDVTNDIAILAPTGSIDGGKTDIQDIVFATNAFDDGSSIIEGEGVLMIGYPLALGIVGNKNHPIVRFGMVAQNAESKTFLIDGVASHGNSGSPVIGLSAQSQNLLGMVQSFDNDIIVLRDENGQVDATLPYNSGLASAVKASVILEDLRNAMGQ